MSALPRLPRTVLCPNGCGKRMSPARMYVHSFECPVLKARRDRTPDHGDRTAPALPMSWFKAAA